MSRIVPQDEFVDTYVLDYTRIAWAARNAEQAARAAGVAQILVTCFAKLYAMCQEHATLVEARTKARSTRADPAAARADHRLDRNYSTFVAKTESEVTLYGADSPRGKAAQAMLDGPLSPPVHTVTNVYREEQETTMRRILAELEQDHLNAIKICELESHFQVLKDDFDAFVDQMTVSQQSAGPSGQDVEASRQDIEAKMLECIWRTGGAYPTASPRDMQMRSKLLGPFAIQNDRLAAFYKRNHGGNPPEIDPETGDEVADEDSTSNDETAVEA